MLWTLILLGLGLSAQAQPRVQPPVYPIMSPRGPDPWLGIKKPTRDIPCTEDHVTGENSISTVVTPTFPLCEEHYENDTVVTREHFVTEDNTRCFTVVRADKPYVLHVTADPTAKLSVYLPDSEFDVHIDKGSVVRVQNCGGFVRVRTLHSTNNKAVFVQTARGRVYVPVGAALNYSEPSSLKREAPCLIKVSDKRAMDRFIKTMAVFISMNYYACTTTTPVEN